VFEARKAQAAVIAAFDELAVMHPNLRLVLVGARPGAYTDGLREQLRRCESRARVQVVPVTADVYPWFAMADVMLCASDLESLPRSILEAMAFGLPIVSTDVFGIDSLIEDGRTGWLTGARDLESLIGRLHLVLRMSTADRKVVGDRARVAVAQRGASGYGVTFARALAQLIDDPSADGAVAFAGPQASGVPA